MQTLTEKITDLRCFPDWVIPDYRGLLYDQSRFLVLVGGAGSGKSFFSAQKCVYRCLAQPGVRGLAARKVGRTIKASCSDQIMAVLRHMGLAHEARQIQTTGDIHFRNGSVILMTGLDDVEKIKSITDIEFVWGEEASEFSVGDMDQLNLRLRTPGLYSQMMLSLNPVGGSNSPIKRRFFDRYNPEASVYVSTIDNNPTLDEAYTDSIERLAESNPTLYAIYRKGEWAVNTEDLIFSNMVILPADKWPRWKDCDEHYYGLDFGYNNPSACVEVGIKDGADYYLSEVLYKRGLTNTDLIEALKREEVNSAIEIIADSAEPDRIQEINDADYWCTPQDKAPHSVRQGISLMQSGRLFVHEESTNLIKELQEYRWKRGKDDILLDEPVKYADHLIDAARGVIFRAFKDKGQSAEVAVASYDYRPA